MAVAIMPQVQILVPGQNEVLVQNVQVKDAATLFTTTINFRQIVERTINLDETIKFLVEHRLLANTSVCG